MTLLKVKNMNDTKNMVDFEIDGKKYCVMKWHLQRALGEVKRWQHTGGSNFTIQLIQLIAKADDENKKKLLAGFPDVVCAYLMWYFKEGFEQKFDNDETFFEAINKRLEN